MIDMLNRCNNKGLFKCYPQDHFVLFHLNKEKPRIKSSSFEYCYLNYDTFMINFSKIIFFIEKNMGEDVFEKIVREYLSCIKNYSDEKFFEKYGNLIIFCGLYSILNCDELTWEINVSEGNLNCRYTEINGMTTQIDFMEWESRKIRENGQYVSVYYGLEKNRQDFLIEMLNEMDIKFYGLYEKQMIDYIESRCVENNLRYIQVIQAEDLEAFFEVQGLLNNATTGLYVSDVLLNSINKRRAKLLLGTLLFQPNPEYILCGNYRYLLQSGESVFLFNTLQTAVNLFEVQEIIYPFRVKCDEDRNYYKINVSERKRTVEEILKLFLQDGKILKEQIVKGIIRKNLEEIPELYKCFEIEKEEAIIEIYKKFIELEKNVVSNYPEGHILTRQGIILDAVGFSLVYCMYIIPTFLKNDIIITDFLQKKLVAQKDGKFNFKMFNEAYGEVEIFLYLFFSIFIKSDLHKNFVRLDYESSGYKNKKYEYTFVFKKFKINIEVKSLECAPEMTDKINLSKMKHGDLFYKLYFPGMESSVLPEDVKKNGKELKSNYRQIGKNIRRIKEKYIGKTEDINLGFIMINYGTSREEFLSYLMHPEYGYLRKNKLGNVDAIVLFSMFMETDLLMDKITEREHMFVFANEDNIKQNDKLFEKLRLKNFVDDTSEKYTSYFNEVYGVYKGINHNGMVSIQRKDVCELEDWSDYDSFQQKRYKIDQLSNLL